MRLGLFIASVVWGTTLSVANADSLSTHGRVLVDFSENDTSEGVQSDLRSARLSLRYLPEKNFTYRIDIEGRDGELELRDAYLGFQVEDIRFKVGQSKLPLGLHASNSTLVNPSMTNPEIVRSVGGGARRIGVEASVDSQNFLFQSGIYGGSFDNSYSALPPSLLTRLVWRRAYPNIVEHFGVVVRAGDGPELVRNDDVQQSKHFAQKLSIKPSRKYRDEQLLMLEGYIQKGPYAVSSELALQKISGQQVSGWYMDVSRFWGGRRRYDSKRARLSAPEIFRKAGAGGLGAVETNLRLEVMSGMDDSSTSFTQTGQQVSASWYINSHARWIAALDRTTFKQEHLTERSVDFSARFQIAF